MVKFWDGLSQLDGVHLLSVGGYITAKTKPTTTTGKIDFLLVSFAIYLEFVLQTAVKCTSQTNYQLIMALTYQLTGYLSLGLQKAADEDRSTKLKELIKATDTFYIGRREEYSNTLKRLEVSSHIQTSLVSKLPTTKAFKIFTIDIMHF